MVTSPLQDNKKRFTKRNIPFLFIKRHCFPLQTACVRLLFASFIIDHSAWFVNSFSIFPKNKKKQFSFIKEKRRTFSIFPFCLFLKVPVSHTKRNKCKLCKTIVFCSGHVSELPRISAQQAAVSDSGRICRHHLPPATAHPTRQRP